VTQNAGSGFGKTHGSRGGGSDAIGFGWDSVADAVFDLSAQPGEPRCPEGGGGSSDRVGECAHGVEVAVVCGLPERLDSRRGVSDEQRDVRDDECWLIAQPHRSTELRGRSSLRGSPSGRWLQSHEGGEDAAQVVENDSRVNDDEQHRG
jgi:hypothetical protein